MNAGRLNKRITIQKATSTQNEFGERVNTWSTVIERWARVEPLRGREFFLAQQAQSEIETKFTIRHATEIKPSMKLVYDGIDYNIESVINVNESDRETEIYCSKITT